VSPSPSFPSSVVREIVANPNLALTNAVIAQKMRELADEIEKGEYGDAVEHVVSIIVPYREPMVRSVLGARCAKAQLIGILAMAQHEELTR